MSVHFLHPDSTSVFHRKIYHSLSQKRFIR